MGERELFKYKAVSLLLKRTETSDEPHGRLFSLTHQSTQSVAAPPPSLPLRPRRQPRALARPGPPPPLPTLLGAAIRPLPTPPKAAAAAAHRGESCGHRGAEGWCARGGPAPLRRGLRLRRSACPPPSPPALLGERPLAQVLEGEGCRGAVHACACEHGAEALLPEEGLRVRRVGRRRPRYHGEALGSHLVGGRGWGRGQAQGQWSGSGPGSGPGSG